MTLLDTADVRIKALQARGFTARQARFLTLVLRHAGVCVPRQYASFAGTAQGAKCNAFFARLVARGDALRIPCLHNRAQLYRFHARPLYDAIGEGRSRYRRVVSPSIAVERLMRLDAVLTAPDFTWLDSSAEKASALGLPPTVPDACPIGLEDDGHIVILYAANDPWPDRFRRALRACAPMLLTASRWTLRICRATRLAWRLRHVPRCGPRGAGTVVRRSRCDAPSRRLGARLHARGVARPRACVRPSLSPGRPRAAVGQQPCRGG